MKMRAWLLLFSLVPILLIAQEEPPTPPVPPSGVEGAALPQAEEVLEKMKAASGGEEIWKNIKTRRTTGKVSIPAAGMSADTSSYINDSGTMREVVNFPDFGEFKQGLDGEMGWANDPIQGPRLLGTDEMKQYKQMTQLHPLARFEENYKKIEVKDRGKINDLDCLHLVFTLKDPERTEHWWVDEEKFLLRKLSTVITSPLGKLPIETVVSDYREIDGMFLPSKLEIIQGPQKIYFDIEKYEHNVDISPEELAIPKGVQALIDRKAAKEEEKEKEEKPKEGEGSAGQGQ